MSGDPSPVLRDLAHALALRRRLLARRLAAFAALATCVLAAAVAVGTPWDLLAAAVLTVAGLHILLQYLAPPGRDYREAVRTAVLAPLCRRLDADLLSAPAPAPQGWPKEWAVEMEIRPDGGPPVLILGRRRSWLRPWRRAGALARRRGAGIEILWQGPRVPFALHSPSDADLLQDDAERLEAALRRPRSP